MESTHVLPLIDEADLHAAFALAPGGGAWEVVKTERIEGTGRDLVLQVWESGGHRQHVAFSGPTLTGLSDRDLEAERERLLRVRDAADAALALVDGHLRYRRGLS